MFVIDNVDAWNLNIRSSSAMCSGVKREFIDPFIAVVALGLDEEMLLFDLKTFGFIFENLCIRDLTVYTCEYGGIISYYPDKHGFEADCLVHLKNGDYALIEFKLGNGDIDNRSKNLLKIDKLIKKI